MSWTKRVQTEDLQRATMSGAESIQSDNAFSAIPQGNSRRGFVPAWLMSFTMHAAIIVLLALLARGIERGADAIENRKGGIVLVKMQSDSTEYLSEGDIVERLARAGATSSPPVLPSQESINDLPGIEQRPTQSNESGKEQLVGVPGADGFSDTSERSREIGGKVTTEVFGVKGTGSEFIYLFDCSASMEGFDARPLRAAKQQLIASLNSLGATHRFQLIFYNHDTKVFNGGAGRASMFFADEKMKKQAANFVQSIRGDGGTDHVNALKFALQFSPDVIFMLTDAEGGFTEAELSQISKWNRGSSVINAIEFGEGPKAANSDRSLDRLARENQGQYAYKDITTLSDKVP